MKIIHFLGKNQVTKEVPESQADASLMLGREGSYLWTGTTPASRYQGWFFGFGDNSMIKVIDDIRPKGRRRIVALEDAFVSVKKTSHEFTETFFLPRRESLVYELDKPGEVEIFFDIKDPYGSPEFGRYYKVWEEDHMIVVRFSQEGGFLLPELFVAICGDVAEAKLKEEWIKRDYRFDSDRGSQPSERWVFMPAVVRAQKIIIAVGTTKESALKSAREAWREFGKIKNESREIQKEVGVFEDCSEVKDFAGTTEMARERAANALKILYSQKDGQAALRAGLPWFFQIWRRDEAVSLKGMSFCDRPAALEMFWRQIDELAACGYHYDDSADAVGWLFLRAGEFINEGRMSVKDTEKIFDVLGKTIDRLLARDTRGAMAVNGPKQTWMDSLARAGAAIEIQALRLNMYELAASIAPTETEKQRYFELEECLAAATKKTFFDGRRLADNFDPAANRADFRFRTNIFLAAYIYPKLLKKTEWNTCFDAVLPALWCEWGGLRTLDKGDPDFVGRDTGEDPAAYHNGDSWFWVNNLAAIALARLDQEKYKKVIDKIFSASASNILWHGVIGCASEISSGQECAAAGCPNQAWSDATFLELFRELKK